MRTIPVGLASHLATKSTTRCWMLRLDLVDGTSIGITSHSRDLDYDLGDGEITYQAKTGIIPSDVSLEASLDPDSYEVTGPIADVVTLTDLLGGRFNNARARLFQVNHQSLGSGALKIHEGDIIDAKPEGSAFRFEIHNDFHRFNTVVGELVTTNCKADFGDSNCRATPVSIAATVASVTDEMRFTVTYSGTYADSYFDFGTVEFLTGDLATVPKMMIQHWDDSGSIELFARAVKAPEVGDTLNVIQGCPKSRQGCIDRNNMINFYHGYPDTPGSAQVLKVPVPGLA